MNIAIVQLGRIGDMVLLTPLLRAIHALYPDAAIDIVAGRKNAAIVQAHPLVRQVHVFDKHPLALLKFIAAVRRARYDWWIDPKDHFSREGSAIVQFAGARNSVGHNRAGSTAFGIGVASDTENCRLHAVERAIRALLPLGIPQPECLLDIEEKCQLWHDPFAVEQMPYSQVDKNACQQRRAALATLRPYLVVGAEEDAYTRRVVGGHTRPVVLANISASHASRMWPRDKWAVVLQRVAESCDIVVSCQPSESDSAREIVRLVPRAQLFPSRSIVDIIALVQCVDAVLTPDTAVVHIAAAFDKPAVVLYPRIHANYRKFRPLSSCAIAVVPPEGWECVEHTSISAVWSAWQALAERVGLPCSSNGA